MSSRPLVIINPKSGAGRTGTSSDETQRIIESALGPVDFVQTERARHATDTGYIVGLTKADVRDALNAAAAVGDYRSLKYRSGRFDVPRLRSTLPL